MKLPNLIRQTIYEMRMHPIISFISIFGSALAIFLIMIVVMIQDIKVQGYPPVSNRDRMLFAQYGSIGHTDWDNGSSNGPYSYETAMALYGNLETAETTTIYECNLSTATASIAKGTPMTVDIRNIDDKFFNVYDFEFISGRPFDSAEFEAGLPRIVITASVARTLFGTTDAAGKEMQLNTLPYIVSGVVKDVSPLAQLAYAEAWPNLKSNNISSEIWCGYMGWYSATILAPSKEALDDVVEECKRRYDDFNRQIEPSGFNMISLNRPYTAEKQAITFSANQEADVKAERKSRWIIYLILILVPALNLSSMTHSRLSQRQSEYGIRRAFGCTRSRLIANIITENLIVTLIAGIIGLIMSVIFALLFDNMLFSIPYSKSEVDLAVSPLMLIHWSTFIMAFIFCFILNLLSAGLPAWQSARKTIVSAITGTK